MTHLLSKPALPVQGLLQDDAVGHWAVSLSERGSLVLDAKHHQSLAARVLQRALAVVRHADHAALVDGVATSRPRSAYRARAAIK